MAHPATAWACLALLRGTLKGLYEIPGPEGNLGGRQRHSRVLVLPTLRWRHDVSKLKSGTGFSALSTQAECTPE